MNNNTEYANLLNLIKQRYSCRKYKDTPVPKELVMDILETARLAPSAVNCQPWKFLVLDTPELKQSVIDCYSRDWVETAPLFIVALGNHNKAWHRGTDNKDHTDIDISIAVEHICLAATSLDLGSCWICNFDAAKFKELLDIPQEWEPIAIIPIGYPAEGNIPEKKRKSTSDIIQWGKF